MQSIHRDDKIFKYLPIFFYQWSSPTHALDMLQAAQPSRAVMLVGAMLGRPGSPARGLIEQAWLLGGLLHIYPHLKNTLLE